MWTKNSIMNVISASSDSETHTHTTKLHTLYSINYFQLLLPLLSFVSYTITENFVYEQGKTCLKKMLCISYSSKTTFSTAPYSWAISRYVPSFAYVSIIENKCVSRPSNLYLNFRITFLCCIHILWIHSFFNTKNSYLLIHEIHFLHK